MRPIPTTVLSLEADVASRRCMRVAAERDRLEPYSLLPPLAKSPLGATVDCVSISENFVHGRIRDVVELHVDSSNDIVLSWLHKQAKPIDSSWASIRDAAKNCLNFDLFTLPQYAGFAGLVEARNAALHGGGRLTRQQQRRSQEVLRALQAAGFSVRSGEVFATPVRPKEIASVCIGLISAVDALTWTAESGLKTI